MDLTGFLIASVIVTLMPGPDILFVFTQGLTFGRRSGIAVSLGLCSGLFVHTTVVALGLAVIITKSPLIFNIIKCAGVAYLAYMGIKAWQSRKKAADSGSGSSYALTFNQLYKRGIMMNLLNPKVIVFFLAFLPHFLDAASPAPKTDTFILGGLFALQAIIIFSTVSVLAGFLSRKFAIDTIPGKTIATINAFVYWGIALFFLAGGIADFVSK